MQLCSSALCVLILLTIKFTTVSHAAPNNVSVKLNDSATLPCDGRCSGLVRWSQNSSGVVAQCNQTSCLSVKDGFVMFYALYLKGNNSLIIPVADPSKTGEYTCQCDHKTISDVRLHIDPIPVNASFHESATLPCCVTCSGLVTWARSDDGVVAQCDQTSCQSMKAGYQMIYDQYLKGEFSLYITDADFSKRGWYACCCNKTTVCYVDFSINALNSTVQIKPGASLVLNLETPDPVEVLYESTGAGGSSSGQICTVDGRSLQCSDDYKQRVSLSPALELKRVNLSDSGVYTIRDIGTKKVLHIYTVTVRDDQHLPREQKIALSVPELIGIVVGPVISTIVIYSVVVVMCKKKRSSCGESFEMKCVAGNGEDNQNAEEQNILPPDQQ